MSAAALAGLSNSDNNADPSEGQIPTLEKHPLSNSEDRTEGSFKRPAGALIDTSSTRSGAAAVRVLDDPNSARRLEEILLYIAKCCYPKICILP